MTGTIFTSNPQNDSIPNVVQGEIFASQARKSLPESKAPSEAELHKQSRSFDFDNGKQDVYTRVTHKIIADLEKGNLTWILCEASHNNHYAERKALCKVIFVWV